MPYYIFSVRQDKSSARVLAHFDQFPAASARAKILRGELDPAEQAFIKMIFASSALEGEQRILEKRQPSSPVEEWEV